MALITCPECGRRISEFAPDCKGCGIPMELIIKILNNGDPQPAVQEPDKKVDSVAKPTKPVTAEKKIRCSICDTLYDLSETSCPNCNYPVFSFTSEPAKQKKLIRKYRILKGFIEEIDLSKPLLSRTYTYKELIDVKLMYSDEVINRLITAYMSRVNKRNHFAQYNLGLLQAVSDYFTIDYDEAAEYLKGAADSGLADAQAVYGLSLDQDEETLKYMQKAAGKNSALAQAVLGSCYLEGDENLEIEQNFEKAADLFMKAAEQGHPFAECNLGNLYRDGQGVEQNYDKAVEYYWKAIEQGDEDAVNQLGQLFTEQPQLILQCIEQGANDYLDPTIPLLDRAYDLVELDSLDDDYRFTPEVKSELLKEYKKYADEGDQYAVINLIMLSLWDSSGDTGEEIDDKLAEVLIKQLSESSNPDVQAFAGLFMSEDSDEGVQAKGLSLIRKAAIKNSSYAQNVLGQLYEKGQNVEKNIEKARLWYTKSAMQGNPYAAIALASLECSGESKDKEWYKKIVWYTKAAELGQHTEALYELGYYFNLGLDIEEDNLIAAKLFSMCKGSEDADSDLSDLYLSSFEDEEIPDVSEYLTKANVQYNIAHLLMSESKSEYDDSLAFDWYLKAAEQGHTEAEEELGRCYAEGIGTEQDYSKAAMWYQKSADHGNENVDYELARMYEKGLGVDQNYKKAAALYKKAVESGSDDAKISLGFMYLYGNGVKQDKEKALEYLESCTDPDSSAKAFFELGKLYEQDSVAEQNYIEAVKCYSKAASLPEAASALVSLYLSSLNNNDIPDITEYITDAHAQYIIGRAYHYGEQAEKKEHKAQIWYTKAAKQGYPDAEYELGNIYYSWGKHTRAYYSDARNWYQKAADHGSVQACAVLGKMYQLGMGGIQDIDNAIRYYDAAGKFGAGELGILYRYGIGVAKNYHLAFEYFSIAAENGDISSIVELAKMYMYGDGVEKNYTKAVKNLEFAVEKNDNRAKYLLGILYENGFGVEKSIEKARELYKSAGEYKEAKRRLKELDNQGKGLLSKIFS